MIVKYIKGDITETHLKYVAHGVNCQGKMGSGVAKAILEKWGNVKPDYHECIDVNVHILVNGNEDMLGTVGISKQDDGTVVFNCFTQEFYGYDGKKYVSYDAVRYCFEAISLQHNAVAIPKIGCGLAGGDWEEVSKIIDEVTGDKLDVYVYEL